MKNYLLLFVKLFVLWCLACASVFAQSASISYYYAAQSITIGGTATFTLGAWDASQGKWAWSAAAYKSAGANNTAAVKCVVELASTHASQGTCRSDQNGSNGAVTSWFVAYTGSSGLLPNTTYEVYAQALWAGNSQSSGSHTSFTTPNAPPTSKQQTIRLDNPTAFDATVSVYKRDPNGVLPDVLVGTYTAKAGYTWAQTFDVNDGKDLFVQSSWKDTSIDGNGDFYSDPGHDSIMYATFVNAQMTTNTGSPSIVPSVGVFNNSASGVPAGLQNATGSTLQGTTIFDSTKTTSTTALDQGTFASGINQMTGQLVGAINNLRGQVATSSGSGGTPDGLTNATFTAQTNSLKTFADDAATDRTAWTTNQSVDYNTLAAGEGATASTSVHTALDSKAGVVTTYTPPSNDDNAFALALPGKTKGSDPVVANITPWTIPDIHGAATMMKNVLALMIFVFYAYFILGEISGYMKAAGSVPQAKGNTIAGSGGQVTGLLAAATLTFLFLAIPTGIAASTDSSLGWGAPVNVMSGFTGTSAGDKAVMLLYEFLPMQTILTAFASGIFVKIAGIGVFTAFAAGTKWVQFVVVFGLLSLTARELKAEINVSYFNSTASTANLYIYDLTLHNYVTQTVDPYAYGGTTFDPIDQSRYYCFMVMDGQIRFGETVECFDDGWIVFNTDKPITVTHPAKVWIMYFMKGFVAGLLCECFGWAFRLFRNMGASREGIA